MSKQATAEKAPRALKPVADVEAAPKKERKPRASTGGGFVGELRASVEKHRASMGKLVAAERKLESKLAAVRAQREAAEGPLRQVEEILASRPELPGFEPVATTDAALEPEPNQ